MAGMLGSLATISDWLLDGKGGISSPTESVNDYKAAYYANTRAAERLAIVAGYAAGVLSMAAVCLDEVGNGAESAARRVANECLRVVQLPLLRLRDPGWTSYQEANRANVGVLRRRHAAVERASHFFDDMARVFPDYREAFLAAYRLCEAATSQHMIY